MKASASAAAAPVTRRGGASKAGATHSRASLVASLGVERFESAKAALTEAAKGGGEDDDALAGGGVQRLLGARSYEEALPRMLKLIFLEECHAVVREPSGRGE